MNFGITWIRHGKTKSNEEHRYLGKTDEELSETGIAEMQRLGTAIAHSKGRLANGNYLVSSPMKRCMQTAEILFKRQPDLLIPQWEEMDFGLFEGKNYLELQGDFLYQAWIDSNGTMPFPDGESSEVFIGRCMDGLKQLLEACNKFEAEQRNITAVVHGGTIMAILSNLTGEEYFDFQVKNGMGYQTVCDWESGVITLSEIKEIEI